MRKNVLLRLAAIFLCALVTLSTLIFTVSCGENTPPDTVADILKGGESEYAIVFSNDGVSHERYAEYLSEFALIDYNYEGFEVYDHNDKTNDKEILIGATSRQLSKDLVTAVNTANTSGKDFVWGYGYRDGKLAFYANCDEAFAYGWDGFYTSLAHDDGMYCDKDMWVIGRKSYSEYLFENKLLFEGKVISFLGDSITSFAGISTEGNEYYYPQNFLNNADDTYWMKLVNNYKMTLGRNDGWSGSRISWDGTEHSNKVGDGIYMASQERIDTLDDNGTPDFIVVYAGTNDIRYEPMGDINEVDWDTVLNYENMTQQEREALPVSDFAHSTASMLAGLKMTYPDAHILVLIPTWVSQNSLMTSDEMVKTRVKEFGDLYIEVCNKFGVDYIDLRTMCTFEERESSGYFGDAPGYIHPSKSGMTKIFEMMKEYYDELMKSYVTD